MLAQLRAAVAHAEAANRRGVLDELLVAWADRPATELAEVIEIVSPDRYPRELREAPPNRQRKEWLAWAERGDPCDVPALLAMLWPCDTQEGLIKVAALSKRPPDPRIDVGVFELMAVAGRANDQRRAFWLAVLDRAAQARDRRVLAWLPYIREAFWRGFARHEVTVPDRLREVEHVLRARFEQSPALSDDERSLLDQIVAAIPPTARAALLAAVHAEPWSDGPRLVYADHLQEQGDPHGAVIAKQVLDKTHREPGGPHLLGPLAALHGHDTVFERGFLAACKLAPDGELRIGNPWWSTVRVLDGGSPALIDHPRMRHLERLVLYHTSWVDLATGHERRLDQLEIRVALNHEPGDWQHQLTTLAAGASLPHLRALSIQISGHTWRPSLAAYRPLLAGVLATRLDYLSLACDGRAPIGHWLAVLHHLPSVKRFELVHGPPENATLFTFQRGAGGRVLVSIGCHWPGEYDREPMELVERLLAQLATLPPGVGAGSVAVAFSEVWSAHDDPRCHQACRQIVKALQNFPEARELVVNDKHRYPVRRG